MDFPRAFRPALLGALLAWAGAVPVAMLIGIAPVFQFRPFYIGILVAIGVVATLGVVAGARRLRLSPRAALFLSALLTFAGFVALVLWILVVNAEGGRW